MTSDNQTYQIKLPHFEGPFDLLLFFIERDEIDVYDIPIADITNDFLDYIRQLNELNIDVASEFIVVAATLMRIKAKLLLPRKEVDETGQEIDPRDALVQQLLEYKKFKSVVNDLKTLEEKRALKERRGFIAKDLELLAREDDPAAELHDLTLFKLLKAFEKVMTKYEDRKHKVTHHVAKYPYTVREKKKLLIEQVAKLKNVRFEKVFDACENKIEAIFTFLAILELIQDKKISIQLGEGMNNFWLEEVKAE
ncbi:MAG: chromosome segregation protein ScpA [Flavobacteriaceae bacterium]|nr:MAG: chromosome segregation protein ScpA [Flavobacteriaceae bacterium]